MILKRNEYINKVGTALNDPKHYKLLNKNPLSSFKKRVKKLLKSWEGKRVFECDIAFSNIDLKIKNTQLSRAYCLIKIHKVGNPVRIIVSEINAPTYNLDNLAKLFKNTFHVQNIHALIVWNLKKILMIYLCRTIIN